VPAYALLAAALQETGKVGIGKVVLHDREDAVMIAPRSRRGPLQSPVAAGIRDIREIRNWTETPVKTPLRFGFERVRDAAGWRIPTS